MSLVRTLVAVSISAGLLGSACTDDATAPTGPDTDTATAAGTMTDGEALAAAEALCPMMWDWVKDVGEVFNVAADEVGRIADVDERRARWEEAFTDIEALDATLLDDVTPLGDDPVLAPLVDEIVRDLPRAQDELDDIRQLFVDHPEIDEQRHQNRTSQIIVRIEKVIDLPKPDLVPNDPDGTLLAAFREVPACQHAIRDVDDGTPTANG